MTRHRDAHRRQAPRVLQVGVQIRSIGLQRQLGDEVGDDHLAVGLLSERLLITYPPLRSVVRSC